MSSMQKVFVKFLSDPVDSSPLKIASFKQTSAEIIDGIMLSKSSWYPIIGGVPRLLTGELKNDVLKKNINFYNKYKNKLPKSAASDWKSQINSIGNLDIFIAQQKKTGESFPDI